LIDVFSVAGVAVVALERGPPAAASDGGLRGGVELGGGDPGTDEAPQLVVDLS
jgi:hypothetical protein